MHDGSANELMLLRHLLSTTMMEPVRRCWKCVTLCSFLYILMMKTPALPIPVLLTVLAIVIMNSTSATNSPC